MSQKLQGMRIAFLIANEGVEQVELEKPWKAVMDEGGEPVLLSPKPGTAQAFNHLDKADTFPVDQPVGEAAPGSFGALVLPGGVANPDQLRTDRAAVGFVQSFFDDGKPVAVICHGPWTLVEAGVLERRTLTSWPSLQTDIRNSGGIWVDEQVAVCTYGPNTLVSSRRPDDLPAFCGALVDRFGRVGSRVH